MSTSRLFSVFVVLTLVIVAVLTIRAGVATSAIVSNANAALDQQERHPDFINLSAPALAEQARLEYRRGEWTAGYNLYAPLDAHERHAPINDAAEQARLDYRRGEWNAGNNVASPQFDVEQARIQWRAGK